MVASGRVDFLYPFCKKIIHFYKSFDYNFVFLDYNLYIKCGPSLSSFSRIFLFFPCTKNGGLEGDQVSRFLYDNGEGRG